MARTTQRGDTAAPTLLDRAIAAVAPRAAVRRMAARMAYQSLAQRGYDGASTGRRTDGWRTASSSADAEISVSAATLRNRMRDLVRNNASAARAVSAWVEDIVGDGFTPYAATGDAELDKRVDKLWAEFAEQMDADGRGDFHAQTTLAVREMVESGEVFARRRRRRMSDGLKVPLQVQAMEIDHLDESRLDYGRAHGHRTIRGIEYDAQGRRTAYWLFPDHPGDVAMPMSRQYGSVRVPAEQVIHLYKRDRVQQRGVPWGAPVIQSLWDLDGWIGAELLRKKLEASLVAIVTGADEGQQGVGPSVTNADGEVIEEFRAGMIAYANGAKQIDFNAPHSVSGNDAWLKAQLHIIAAGWNLPYERLTSDLGDVSFISGRLGRLDHQRAVSALQWQLVVPVWCQPIWDWFTETAWAAGLIPQPRVPVEWQPCGFEALEPQKEAAADLAEMRMGTQTLPQAIAKRGYNPKALLRQIAETNELLDELGLVLDSDPRQRTQQGQSQDEENGDGDGREDGDGERPRAVNGSGRAITAQ